MKREFPVPKLVKTDNKQLQAFLISFSSPCIFLDCSGANFIISIFFQIVIKYCFKTNSSWISSTARNSKEITKRMCASITKCWWTWLLSFQIFLGFIITTTNTKQKYSNIKFNEFGGFETCYVTHSMKEMSLIAF